MLLHSLLGLLDYAIVGISLDLINKIAGQRFILHVKMIMRLSLLDNVTLLHFACFYGYSRLIKGLLYIGMKPNIQDALGKTPLHFAVDGRNFKLNIQNNIVSEQKQFNEMQQFRRMVMLLIQHGANVDMQDTQGRTPLFHAVMYDQPSLVQYLAQQCHASVNVVSVLQQAPLHWVKSVRMAQLLFQMGAELTLNLKDQWHRIPLHMTVHHQNKALTQWFLEHGAHIDAKDKMGKTPRKNLADNIIACHTHRLNTIKRVFQIEPNTQSVVVEDWLKLKHGVQYWVRWVDVKKGLYLQQADPHKKTRYIPAEIISMIDAEVGASHGLQPQDWNNLKSTFFKQPRMPCAQPNRGRVIHHDFITSRMSL